MISLHPLAWPRAHRDQLASALAALMEVVRAGRLSTGSPTADALAAASALARLEPILTATTAELTATIHVTEVELAVRAKGPDLREAPRPALDPALAGDDVAALGALDCRGRAARQRRLLDVWRAAAGPGGGALAALSDAEQAFEGPCSFAVRTAGEVWSEVASHPLRAGARPEALLEAYAAAIRSGGLPGLQAAIDDLPAGRLLFHANDGTLALDRVMATDSPQARQAAAVEGGAVLRRRYAVRDRRLLAAAGADADQRLQASGAKAAPPLPAELARALAAGRGQGGFLFLDLTALWRPYLKAAQLAQSPLAALVARNAALFKERRPVVLTLEPAAGLDASITMPPATFAFLLAVAAMLSGT
jgi:hypothetical protein